MRDWVEALSKGVLLNERENEREGIGGCGGEKKAEMRLKVEKREKNWRMAIARKKLD